MDERKLAGANYIINFFNEIQQLNHHYSLYLNYLLQLNTKYGSSPDNQNILDNEKEYLSNLTQGVRHYVHKVFIQYEALYSSIDKLQLDTKIKEMYQKIANTYIINSNELREFVLLINKTLINDVIKDLLVSSQEILSSVFSNNESSK